MSMKFNILPQRSTSQMNYYILPQRSTSQMVKQFLSLRQVMLPRPASPMRVETAAAPLLFHCKISFSQLPYTMHYVFPFFLFWFAFPLVGLHWICCMHKLISFMIHAFTCLIIHAFTRYKG